MEIISEAGIVLNATPKTPEEAILESGNLLVSLGAVSPEYLAAMFEREQSMSSAVGAGIAIPHGTESAREFVNFDQVAILCLAEPIQWKDQVVHLVVAIASKSNTHVNLLSKIAQLATEGRLSQALGTKSKAELLGLLNN